MQLKFLHILKEQTQKIKKNVAKKLNSKWPLNSRWLVQTTKHLFSKKKKKIRAVLVA
jgi:geranylgeranyl pyrophosphate synthase